MPTKNTRNKKVVIIQGWPVGVVPQKGSGTGFSCFGKDSATNKECATFTPISGVASTSTKARPTAKSRARPVPTPTAPAGRSARAEAYVQRRAERETLRKEKASARKQMMEEFTAKQAADFSKRVLQEFKEQQAISARARGQPLTAQEKKALLSLAKNYTASKDTIARAQEYMKIQQQVDERYQRASPKK